MEVISNPHEWCIPNEYLKTVDPNSRLGHLLLAVLEDCHHCGGSDEQVSEVRLPENVRPETEVHEH